MNNLIAVFKEVVFSVDDINLIISSATSEDKKYFESIILKLERIAKNKCYPKDIKAQFYYAVKKPSNNLFTLDELRDNKLLLGTFKESVILYTNMINYVKSFVEPSTNEQIELIQNVIHLKNRIEEIRGER